jgi:hypothetical protein
MYRGGSALSNGRQTAHLAARRWPAHRAGPGFAGIGTGLAESTANGSDFSTFRVAGMLNL